MRTLRLPRLIVKLLASRMDECLSLVSFSAGETVDLSTASGNYVSITGTGAEIKNFGSVQAGARFTLLFNDQNEIKDVGDTGSVILPGGNSITVSDGDIVVLISEGGGMWRLVSFTSGANSSEPWSVPAVSTFQLPDPAPTTDVGGVMMGFGASLQFQKNKSGYYLITVYGNVSSDTAIDGGAMQLYYGDTALNPAPANGDALGQTQLGTLMSFMSADANGKTPFSLTSLLIVPANKTYFVDLALSSAQLHGVSEVQLSNVTFIATEF